MFRNLFDICFNIFSAFLLTVIFLLLKSDCHNAMASFSRSKVHSKMANFSLIVGVERPAAMLFLRILADNFKDLDSCKLATSARIGSSSS